MAGLVTDFWKTVHSPLFFRKIVEIERYVYGLPTCMRSKILRGRGRFGRKVKTLASRLRTFDRSGQSSGDEGENENLAESAQDTRNVKCRC